MYTYRNAGRSPPARNIVAGRAQVRMKGLVVALHVVLLLERLRAVGARKRPLAKVDGADVVLEIILACRG